MVFSPKHCAVQEPPMMRKFKIIVAAYNCTSWLRYCLESIDVQIYRNFDVCIIDDASTDPEMKVLISSYVEKCGWQALFNASNEGGLSSVVKGIAASQCEDDDVICILDGDDWFYSPMTLQIVANYYQREDICLSYGSFETFPPGQVNESFLNQPLPQEVMQKQQYRDFPWIFVHMQTFKYYLWKHVDHEDLKDADGCYFRICGDRARFYTLLELAGPKIRKIPEILYVYNMKNALNHFRIRPEEQKKVLERVKAKPRSKPLFAFN